MKNGKMKKIGATLLAVSVVGGTLGMTSCGGNSDAVQFWAYGSQAELAAYVSMTNKFNETYGKEHGIEVRYSEKPAGSYPNLIQTTGTANSGADVFLVIEDDFKKWVEYGFMPEMDDYFAAVTDIDLSGISENTLLKYRYDRELECTKPDSPLYGMPVETRPTALYYNESVFEEAGIIVISVDEEDMDAWNAGTIADKRGKYKSEFAALANITVPKKGYYRSMYPYTLDTGWEVPTGGEVLVFNNRIAMNWDEVEDLAMIFSKQHNPQAKTQYGTDYGYYTEWWFNYGWSVGGDCLADLNGTGYWNFSLLENYPNYKVEEDSYVGAFTGTTYKKGEFLELTDKVNVEVGQRLVADDEGGYSVNGAPATVRASVATDEAAGKLTAYPSTREAFERYVRLGTNSNVIIGGAGGLQLAPTPSVFSGSGRLPINYFADGALAIVAEQSSYIPTVAETADFKWDLAPLVQYKEYEDPLDPNCDTVVRLGAKAGHSNSKFMATRKKSVEQKGDKIARFIMWMASEEAQIFRAQQGLFPNQKSLLNQLDLGENAPTNIAAFSEALEWQTPPDWWYLKGNSWIEEWSVPLNTKLRNNVKNADGTQYTYAQWIAEGLSNSNQILYDNYILDSNK